MYIEYETWLTKGDLVYRIMNSKIETWRIRKVEVTITDIINDDINYSTLYYIEPVDCKSLYSRGICHNQDSLQREFCRDKKDLVQKIVSQL